MDLFITNYSGHQKLKFTNFISTVGSVILSSQCISQHSNHQHAVTMEIKTIVTLATMYSASSGLSRSSFLAMSVSEIREYDRLIIRTPVNEQTNSRGNVSFDCPSRWPHSTSGEFPVFTIPPHPRSILYGKKLTFYFVNGLHHLLNPVIHKPKIIYFPYHVQIPCVFIKFLAFSLSGKIDNQIHWIFLVKLNYLSSVFPVWKNWQSISLSLVPCLRNYTVLVTLYVYHPLSAANLV